MHYTADMGDPATDEDVRCLCLEPEGCMPKNVFNAGPCLNVPIRISLPHFYDSDPRYYEMIDGVTPDPVSFARGIWDFIQLGLKEYIAITQEKHQMTFDFDPMTGTPIRAYKKIQFNVLIGPVPKLKLMKSFPEALFPIFWIEDGLELGDVLKKPLIVAYMQIRVAR